jgi:hypothetical protein
MYSINIEKNGKIIQTTAVVSESSAKREYKSAVRQLRSGALQADYVWLMDENDNVLECSGK